MAEFTRLLVAGLHVLDTPWISMNTRQQSEASVTTLLDLPLTCIFLPLGIKTEREKERLRGSKYLDFWGIQQVSLQNVLLNTIRKAYISILLSWLPCVRVI